jgi:hypothetical protein
LKKRIKMNAAQGRGLVMSDQQSIHDPSAGETDRRIFILLVGGVLYGALCMPSIEQRGYPPLDPFWEAMRFLWIFPLLLSAVFDRRPLQLRARPIAIYALVTAFFDSGTLVVVVPNSVSLIGMLFLTLFPYGPVHFAIAFLLEVVIQRVRRRFRRTDAASDRSLLESRARWTVVCGILIVAVATPIVFRRMSFWDADRRGRAQAEQNWADGKAVIYGRLDMRTLGNGLEVIRYCDYQTGLRRRPRIDLSHFGAAYNHRIAQLVAEFGVPAWSMRRLLPSDEDLLTALGSNELPEIHKLPYDVSDSIVVGGEGALTRWNSTSVADRGSISIITKQTSTAIGGDIHRVYVGRLAKYPGVIFIRGDKKWITAFTEDGEELVFASRE